MAGAAGFAACAAALWFGFEAALAAATALLHAAASAASAEGDLVEGLRAVGPTMHEVALRGAGPALAASTLLSVLASVAVLRGLPVSAAPLTPDAGRLDPVKGVKRIFSLATLAELLKSLLKVALLGAVLLAVLSHALGDFLLTPPCGLPCAAESFARAARAALAGASAVFLAVGLADVALQRWLFRREQRMSLEEVRREWKEEEGDPHVKAILRQGLAGQTGAPARGGRKAGAGREAFVRPHAAAQRPAARHQGAAAPGEPDRASPGRGGEEALAVYKRRHPLVREAALQDRKPPVHPLRTSGDTSA
jgi:flagellar biosynthesis protein FlhB